MQTHHGDTAGVQSKEGRMSLFFFYMTPPQPLPALSDASGILPQVLAGSLINHRGGGYRTKGITWQRGTADAKGFNSGTTIRSLHSERRVVGSRLSAQVRSGDGSIINTV